MGWSIGYDNKHKRDIGYGVPAVCDYPGCDEKIDRGLAYTCGGEPSGGEHGCGLHFCEKHREIVEVENGEYASLCERCANNQPEFEPKPDIKEWRDWKRTHESWKQWREENPELAAAL